MIMLKGAWALIASNKIVRWALAALALLAVAFLISARLIAKGKEAQKLDQAIGALKQVARKKISDEEVARHSPDDNRRWLRKWARDKDKRQ